MPYSAFVSYSHALDGQLGAALQSGLHRFARRWYQLRALRVFRDITNLTPNPGLWHSITKALGESEFFILLASPVAANSKWVRREVEFWLQEKARERLLLVVTDGRIAWDDDAGDFDWDVTDCLPPQFRGVFEEEPKYIDLRWARTVERLSLKNPVFLDNVADLAAILHARDKDALIGEDIREHRKVKVLAGSAIVTLTVLTAVSVIAAAFAVMQRDAARVARNRAEEQRQIATARSLAVEAQLLREDRAHRLPQSVLLALESYQRAPSAETYRALRSGLALLPRVLERDATTVPPAQPVVEGRCRDASRGAEAATRDGRYVASVVGEGGAVEVRRREGGDVVYKTDVGSLCVHRLALSGDASHLAVYGLGDRGGLWILETATDARKALIVPHWSVSALALSDDSRYLATGGDDTTVRVWNWREGREIALARHSEAVTRAAFDGSGRYLATSSNDDTVRVWEMPGGREVARVAVKGFARRLDFSPDGRRLAIATPGGVDRVELVSPLELRHFEHDLNTSPFNIRTTPSGKHLMVLASDHELEVWDAESDKVVIGESGVWAAALHPGGNALALARETGAIEVRTLDTGAIASTLPPPPIGSITMLAFSSDGQRLVGASNAKGAHVWTPGAVQDPVSIPHDAEVWAASFVAGHGRLLTLDQAGVLREWDVNAAATAVSAKPLVSPTYPDAASFSADGRYVAIFNRQRRGLEVIDAGSGKRAMFIASEEDTARFAFSADSRYIAVVSQRDPRFREGNSVSVVDLHDRTEVAVITSEDHVSDVAFSGDGKSLATVGHYQSSVWLWRPEDLVAEACRRLTRNLTLDEWRRHVGDEPYRKTCPGLAN